jgi:hypothetical protein
VRDILAKLFAVGRQTRGQKRPRKANLLHPPSYSSLSISDEFFRFTFWNGHLCAILALLFNASLLDHMWLEFGLTLALNAECPVIFGRPFFLGGDILIDLPPPSRV